MNCSTSYLNNAKFHCLPQAHILIFPRRRLCNFNKVVFNILLYIGMFPWIPVHFYCLLNRWSHRPRQAHSPVQLKIAYGFHRSKPYWMHLPPSAFEIRVWSVVHAATIAATDRRSSISLFFTFSVCRLVCLASRMRMKLSKILNFLTKLPFEIIFALIFN